MNVVLEAGNKILRAKLASRELSIWSGKFRNSCQSDGVLPWSYSRFNMYWWILCFHVTSCIFQNVKSQSPWVFSFLWLLNILNTFRFEGFQFNSNLRFYSRAFWNSVFSRHRTCIKMAERMRHVCLKKITHSVIFSNLNCWVIVKSAYVDIF